MEPQRIFANDLSVQLLQDSYPCYPILCSNLEQHMKSKSIKSLEDRIFLKYDQESRIEAIEFIKNNPNNFDADHLANLMMLGRNAQETRSQIRACSTPESAEEDKTSPVIDELDDDTAIARIKSGDIPYSYELPRKRWLAVYEKIKRVVATEKDSKSIFNFFYFLLTFEDSVVEPHVVDPEAVEIAISWIRRNKSDPVAKFVLQEVLKNKKSKSLLPLAKEVLEASSWDMKSTYLLVEIMHLCSNQEKNRLFKRKKNIFKTYDYILIPHFVYSTNCSRRSFKYAKKWMNKRKRLDVRFAFFQRRMQNNRFIYKWIIRFFKRYKDQKEVQRELIEFISMLPSKELISLAKEIKSSVSETQQLYLIETMIRKTRDRESIDFAVDYIQKFPDAPISFRLMTCIASIQPDLAVPWFDDWQKTAIGIQKASALKTLLHLAPSKQYIDLACDHAKDIVDDSHFRRVRSKLTLMIAIHRVDPKNEIFKLVSDLRQRYERRYPRHLKKLVRMMEGQ